MADTDKDLVRIVSRGGLAQGTKVMLGDSEIPNITGITIDPIDIGGVVSATISLSLVELDLAALKDG